MPAKPTTAGAYMKALAPDRKKAMTTLRSLVKKTLPKAKESFEYGVPAYQIDGTFVAGLASQKQYLALYVCEVDVLKEFPGEFAHLNCGKSCIRFRKMEDLPQATVKKVLRLSAKRARENPR